MKLINFNVNVGIFLDKNKMKNVIKGWEKWYNFFIIWMKSDIFKKIFDFCNYKVLRIY